MSASVTATFRSTDISGNYAEMARALGGYGEPVSQPAEIVPAIRRAIKRTEEGVPAPLEFLTSKAITFSICR
jgi:acetolactate synthase-1/2/3 large subunit